MSSISFDGMASGIDTTSVIQAILSAEKMPILHMESQLAEGEAKLVSLRNLNQNIAALSAATKNLTSGTSFRPATGTSSIEGVSVAVKDGAASTSLDFRVDAVATRHSGVSSAMSDWDGSELTIATAEGTSASFTAGSLSELVTQINASEGLGVSATLVRASDAADGTAQYRLQLTSKETGVQAAFTATAGGADLFAGGALTSQGADAAITLFPGTAAEQSVSSSTNTFTDLATGVDLTVTAKAVGSTGNVTSSNDSSVGTARAKEMIDQINALLSAIGNATKVTTVEDSKGQSTQAGQLTGDLTVRMIQDRIFAAATRPTDGSSQAFMGIEPDRYGAITFDEAKMAQAMAADPDKVGAALTAMAERVHAVAKEVSDQYGGTLTRVIESRVSDNRRTQDAIDHAEGRLAMREATLRTTFTAMELMLNKFNSLQTYLTGQFAAFANQNKTS